MVVAHWYRPSGWLGPMRLLRGRFKGKGAVGGMSPFPVADSPETTPPGLGSFKQVLVAAKEIDNMVWGEYHASYSFSRLRFA